MSYIVPNNVSLNNLTASNHVSSSAFYGDGSGLSNIATGGLTAVSTSGNITGSGTSLDPVGIKPDPQFNTVTASVVTASDVITDYINFNSNTDPAWENGRVWYNNTSHELNYWTEVNGFNIKIGQQVVQRCINNQGSLLTKGSVVYITGSTSSDTPRIVLADWTGENLSANTLGLVAENIAIGATGYVITQGILKGIGTNVYNPGQILYLSSSGQITGTKPISPKHTVSIGQVVRKQSNNGSIYVSIQNGYEISELHDVITNGKTNGDLLTWDSSSAAWKNSNVLSGSYTFSGSQTITGSLRITNSITSSNGISARLYGTASYALDSDLFDGQDSSLFALKTDVSGAITGGLAPYATLTGVSASFTTPTQVSGAITGALTPYARSSNVSSSFGLKTDLTASYARLNVSNTFTQNQTITGSLFVLNAVSASQLTGSFKGDGSQIINIPSSAVNLSSYATLTGVSSSFTTPTQASGAITGALSPYVLSSALSSSFVTNTAATASLAFLTASNVFTTNQTITGSLNVSTRISSSQFTGSFSGSFFGDGSGLTNIPAGTITVGGNITGSGTVVSPYGVNINPLFVNTTSSTIRATNYLIIGTSSNNNYAPNMVQIARPDNCHLTISDTTASVVLGSTKGVPAFPYSYVGTQTNHDFVILRNNTPLVALSSSNFSPINDLSIDLGGFTKRWNRAYIDTLKDIDNICGVPIEGVYRPISLYSTLEFVQGGIAFSTNGDVLSDYEEGTFTPVSSKGTGFNGSGRYIKIGNLVNIHITISGVSPDWNKNDYWTGMPFVASNVASGIFSIGGDGDRLGGVTISYTTLTLRNGFAANGTGPAYIQLSYTT